MSTDQLHEAFEAERSDVELRSVLLGEMTRRRELPELELSAAELLREHRGW